MTRCSYNLLPFIMFMLFVVCMTKDFNLFPFSSFSFVTYRQAFVSPDI